MRQPRSLYAHQLRVKEQAVLGHVSIWKFSERSICTLLDVTYDVSVFGVAERTTLKVRLKHVSNLAYLAVHITHRTSPANYC